MGDDYGVNIRKYYLSSFVNILSNKFTSTICEDSRSICSLSSVG